MNRVPAQDAAASEWLDAIASPEGAPAGGAAAALTGAMAAATLEKVAGMTLTRERYAAFHRGAEDARHGAFRLRESLLDLARRDAEAFEDFRRALALPRGSEPERAARDLARRAALFAGAELQLEVLRHLAQVAEVAVELAEHGLATALGDSATAGFLAAGAARSAYWAVRSNVGGEAGSDEWSRRLGEALELLTQVEAVETRIGRLASERFR
jgi:formiminotetrahydrofolate cyclodeaminase